MGEDEIRLGELSASNDEGLVVEGYALKFNTYSENLGGFKEVITPNALQDTDMSDVRCFVDHNTSQILGRTTSGTLELAVDDIGLKVRCSLPNNTLGRDTYESVKRGDLSQMSFAFILADNGDKFTREQDLYIRTLTNIAKITEVSIVAIPAYSDTDIAVAKRSLNNAINYEKERLVLRLELMREY